MSYHTHHKLNQNLIQKMSETEVEFVPAEHAVKRSRSRKTDPTDTSGQAKNMIFTLWTDKLTELGTKSYETFIEQVKGYVEDGLFTFAAIGPLELATTTNRPHRHGMFCLSESRRFKVIQEKFLLSKTKPCDSIFFMRMEGTPEQAFRYLSKTSAQDNPEGYSDSKGKVHLPGTSIQSTLCFGEKPKAWKGAGGIEKDRHAEIVRLAELGDLDGIKTFAPDVYLQRFQALHTIAAKKRSRTYIKQELPDVRYYYGVSWSGKSTAAFEECETDEDRAKIYCKVAGANDWFDGYDPEFHTTILWDEMAYHKNLNIQVIKQLTTSIQFHAQVKGSSVPCRPGKVIFTSNYHPEAVFLENADYRAMRNRMSLRYYPISYKKWREHFTDSPNFYVEYPAGSWPSHSAIVDSLPARIKKLVAEEEEADLPRVSFFNLPPLELRRSSAIMVQDKQAIAELGQPGIVREATQDEVNFVSSQSSETPEISTDPSNFVTPDAPKKAPPNRPSTPVPKFNLEQEESEVELIPGPCVFPYPKRAQAESTNTVTSSQPLDEGSKGDTLPLNE